MSKAISFGFGKSKPAGISTKLVQAPVPSKKLNGGFQRNNDSDYEDEAEPQHESVAGFSSDGVILSKPVQAKEEKVIQSQGNGDWRNRGRTTNLLPAEVQAARNEQAVLVEKDEVSTASGLQYATRDGEPENEAENSQSTAVINGASEPRILTEDEIAIAALVGDRPKSNAVIATTGNFRLRGQDETADFQEDVASRPNSSTLEEYAAMPVEEFGMAMLRGMGQKRKAAGQSINLEDSKGENPRKVRKQEGYLGIGAKQAPGTDVEVGAWGKADMRKNNKGDGFFTPLMRVNQATGERITEEEFQKRLKDSKNQKPTEDWRDRRDRNLERSGRDRDEGKRKRDQKAITNGSDHESSRQSTPSRRDREDRDEDKHRSRRRPDDRDYDSSRSQRDRSRSRDRRRGRGDRNGDEDYDSRSKEKNRDRYRDDDRYESSSSHRSGHRDDSRERVRGHRDRDDDRRHRDRR